MNLATATLLTPAELNALRGDVAALYFQGGAGRTVTYRVHLSAASDFSTGVVTKTTRDYQVGAMRQDEEKDVGDGAQVGECVWIIAAAQIPIADVGMADQIVDGSDVYQVLRGERDPTGTLWRFVTRREGTT